jgi:hypothetical protein
MEDVVCVRQYGVADVRSTPAPGSAKRTDQYLSARRDWFSTAAPGSEGRRVESSRLTGEGRTPIFAAALRAGRSS